MGEVLNTLIYKRTHNGDPNESGIFGIDDCMGQVRRWPFDAVIGVGGKSPWRGYEGIAFKINWIGLTPHKSEASSPEWSGVKRLHRSKDYRGPLIKFKCFLFWGDKGPDLRECAPKLFNYMFAEQQVRVVMSRSLPREMQQEVQEILHWAEKKPTQEPSSKVRLMEKDVTVALPGCKKKISFKRKC